MRSCSRTTRNWLKNTTAASTTIITAANTGPKLRLGEVRLLASRNAVCERSSQKKRITINRARKTNVTHIAHERRTVQSTAFPRSRSSTADIQSNGHAIPMWYS